ncbi:MAG: ParB N-terminal domain-containing protein [Phycisphaerales bacterium]|nr:ParB N-terminal domain-containing protein [Phycisphaerales bacterium]
MNAFKVELRPIAEIKPFERNPRLNDDAVQAVANSITSFGWRQPIVVDGDGVIICGHTRWKAAQRLGLEMVPVHVATDLTPEQVRAYRIADNKSAELAEWNMELLPLEMGELQGAGIDWSSLGFSADDLAKIFDPGVQDGLTDPDAIPEPPDDPITKRGDLWVLGEHRLLCGDSASAADVDRLLDGQPIHLVNTDPPYNVKVEPRSNNAIAAGVTSFARRADLQCDRSTTERGKQDRERKAKRTHHQSFDVARQGEKKRTTRKMRAKDRPLENDFVSDDAFEQLLLAWFGNIARVLLPGRAFYCWGGYANVANYPPALKACGLYFSQTIIWHKQHPVLTRKDFMGDHEWCFYSWREGAAHVFLGPNNVPDVWSIKKINPASMEHLTQKPVELAVRAMQYSSRVGENVLDLFGGSGSSLIAAEQTQRRAFLMEIDPAYADVIVDRYQRFSGRPAVLERTGESPIPMKPREEKMR